MVGKLAFKEERRVRCDEMLVNFTVCAARNLSPSRAQDWHRREGVAEDGAAVEAEPAVE